MRTSYILTIGQQPSATATFQDEFLSTGLPALVSHKCLIKDNKDNLKKKKKLN